MKFNTFNFLIGKIAPKKSVRSELMGVFVNGKETVATDSFRMLRVDSVNDGDSNSFKAFIMPRDDSELNAKKSEVTVSELSRSNRIDGEYPEYQKVINREGGYETVIVNSRYLKELLDFFSKFSNELSICIPHDKNHKIHFTAVNKDTKQSADGLLMPIYKQ